MSYSVNHLFKITDKLYSHLQKMHNATHEPKIGCKNIKGNYNQCQQSAISTTNVI